MNHIFSLFNDFIVYGIIGISTFATGLVTVAAIATFAGGSGGCGNTTDLARTALFYVAPGGVLTTFGFWRLFYFLGFTHPIGRTLSLMSLALWIFGLIVSP